MTLTPKLSYTINLGFRPEPSQRRQGTNSLAGPASTLRWKGPPMRAKPLIAAIAALSLGLAGCTGSARVGQHTYSAYGLVNKDDKQNPAVHYHVSVWNCVLAVVFVESVIVPAVVVGWQLWVPDGTAAAHTDPAAKGVEG